MKRLLKQLIGLCGRVILLTYHLLLRFLNFNLFTLLK